MIDFSWKVFSQTGNIETYLIFKELEQENQEPETDQEITAADETLL
ncbi:YqzL family protein [Bacillus marinisedimentorum]|nr:YqzL family protein [Bacillus marinisedimentorum]